MLYAFLTTDHGQLTTDGVAFSGDALNPSTEGAIFVIKRPEVPSSKQNPGYHSRGFLFGQTLIYYKYLPIFCRTTFG
jgi:hypothetical protein